MNSPSPRRFLINKSRAKALSPRQLIAAFILLAFYLKAHAGVTSFYVESDPGDYIENGQSFFFTPADGAFRVVKNEANGVSVYFDSPQHNHWFFLGLAAPGSNVLSAGAYLNAAYYPYQEPDEPGLSFLDGFGFSHTVTGWFQVRQIVFGSSNDVQQFWATFEQHINGEIPGIRGEVRFNAELPLAIAAPTYPSTAAGRPISFSVTATEAENRIVSLTASNLPPGATFVDNGNNSGILSWAPNEHHFGVYPITFAADNFNGATDQIVSRLTVNEPDDFSNAVVIAILNFTNSFNMSSATKANDDPAACNIYDRTIWYSFTPERDMKLEAAIGSDYHATLAVYTGERGSLNYVGCGSSFSAKTKISALAGETYYFMVGIVLGPATLTFSLIDLMPPPNPVDRHAVHRYFPLHAGDSEYYSGVGVGLTHSVAAVDFNGLPMFSLRNSIDQSTTTYTYSETSLVMHAASSATTQLSLNTPFAELTEEMILNGGTRTAHTTGNVGAQRFNLTFKVAVKDAGTVTVPAGTFQNCREVTEGILLSVPGGRSSKSHQRFIIAPEVGIIKIFNTIIPTHFIGLVSGTIDGVSVSTLTAKSAIASPRILSQPENDTTLLGAIATFDVTADGSGPLSFQWVKNGTNLANSSFVSGADTPHLVLSAVSDSDAGSYSVTITNQAGLISSRPATLTITPDKGRPILTIRSPRPRSRFQDSDVTVTGKAADKAAVSQVFYQLNGNAWLPALGTTNWQAPVSLSVGTNIFRAYASDYAGNRSTTNSLTVFFTPGP
jgi:hypothetical protein